MFYINLCIKILPNYENFIKLITFLRIIIARNWKEKNKDMFVNILSWGVIRQGQIKILLFMTLSY